MLERVFDEFLRARPASTIEILRPFSRDDYFQYVDGKPRYDGATSFLSSRQIELAPGSPSDPPGHSTVCALGNLKDRDFERAVAEEGVTLFDSTVSFVRALHAQGVSTGLISSSRHARLILAASHIDDLFDIIFDGVDADAVGLPGKPDPAIFLTAARHLHVAPARGVVVEDAAAGVEAGRRGGFALVIGIARESQADELLDHGASVVVHDLSELELQPAILGLPW